MSSYTTAPTAACFMFMGTASEISTRLGLTLAPSSVYQVYPTRCELPSSRTANKSVCGEAARLL